MLSKLYWELQVFNVEKNKQTRVSNEVARTNVFWRRELFLNRTSSFA